MNIDKIVSNIEGQLRSLSSQLVDSYKELEATLSAKESMVEKITREYLEYSKLIHGLQAEHKAKEEELNRRSAELDESKRLHSADIKALKEAQADHDAAVKSLAAIRGEIKNLESQKAALTTEVDTLYRGVKNAVDTMEGKIAELNALEDEIRKAREVSQSDLTRAAALLKDAQEERAALELETKEQREFILAKSQELKEKEKALKEKEETLRIIESRYTKLFGDQGIKIRV